MGFVFSGDKVIMFFDNCEVFLMFGVVGLFWILYGLFIGLFEDVEEVVYSFVDVVCCVGVWLIFYEVGFVDVLLMLDLGMMLYKMGEEVVVDLCCFLLEGLVCKCLCIIYVCVGCDGLMLELVMLLYDVVLMVELCDIFDEWLMVCKLWEKGFLVGWFLFDWLDRWVLVLVC